MEEKMEDKQVVEICGNICKMLEPIVKQAKQPKCKQQRVTLTLQEGTDGHWLVFKASDGTEAVINIENHFPKNGLIINSTIRRWAQEQFEEKEIGV